MKWVAFYEHAHTYSREVVERLTANRNVLAAVRMDRKNDKVLKRKRNEVDSDEFDENQENIETVRKFSWSMHRYT